MHLVNALPGVAAQGLIWGIMAIGVYITFRILDVADLTVDGTMATGGAAFIMLTMAGAPVPLAMLGAFLAGVLAGLVTGLFHTACGIPAILAGILTQLALYSVNLRIMGQANRPVSSRQYDLLVDQQSVRSLSLDNPILVVAILWRRSLPCCTGSSARSWVPPCGLLVPTPICPGPRASTPTSPRCWA